MSDTPNSRSACWDGSSSGIAKSSCNLRIECGEQEPPSVLLSATRLLYHMGNILRDNAPAPAATGVQIERKRLAQLRQKRVALGHKPDDHEFEPQGYTMQFR